jgi:transcriptional regulator with GAF, ATPase, and Fis domain
MTKAVVCRRCECAQGRGERCRRCGDTRAPFEPRAKRAEAVVVAIEPIVPIAELTRRAIENALRQHHSTRAAKELGMSRSALWRWVQKYEIPRPARQRVSLRVPLLDAAAGSVVQTSQHPQQSAPIPGYSNPR